MKNILVFLCSGMSSRFNGKTKALAEFQENETVIEFNLKGLPKEYETVYIVANENNFSEFEQLNLNAKLIKIKTGNGDADSLLNALDKLKELEDFNETDLTFCWGDTIFTDNEIFRKVVRYRSKNLLVPCSLERDPYAYFDFITDNGSIDNALILKSHFRNDKSVEIGLHDQSIFKMPLNDLYSLLKQFKEQHFRTSNTELKFLKFIDWSVNKIGTVCLLVEANSTDSFNTPEELEHIKSIFDII